MNLLLKKIEESWNIKIRIANVRNYLQGIIPWLRNYQYFSRVKGIIPYNKT